jgi:hypothetical protein
VTRVCYQSQFFLEMGFCKLFTLAGLELWSFQFQLPV